MSEEQKTINDNHNNKKGAYGPFASLQECIVFVKEDQQVDDIAARGICENMADSEEETTAASTRDLDTVILSPTTIASSSSSFSSSSSSSSTELGEDTVGDNPELGGNEEGEDITEGVPDDDNTEDPDFEKASSSMTNMMMTTMMTSADQAELNSLLIVKGQERQPGETMADCVTRIMEEDEVDEETAREACSGGGSTADDDDDDE